MLQRWTRLGGHSRVRKLSVATILSMVCHGAAIVWIAHDGGVLAVRLRGDARPAAVPPPEERPALPERGAEPLSVVLLDPEHAPAPVTRDDLLDPPQATGRRPPQPGGARRDDARPDDEPRESAPPGSAALSTGGATRGETPAAPGRSPWMTMRRPTPGQLEVSPEFLADFLARSKELAPPPDIPWERLTGEIAELRARRRRATSQDEIDALRYQIVELYKALAAEELKPSGRGTYTADKETFTARVAADGSVELRDKPRELDWQDRMMLSQGADPYARNKLALLDRTRGQRVALGERHRREQLGRATALMLRNIDRLWAMTTDLAARKEGLFELWDDCAETGSEELVEAGAAARRLVVGAIRGRLRDGDAYTAEELARLNARRRSTAMFSPYE
jgi:hypothetical protein